jgi:hypothetical protein
MHPAQSPDPQPADGMEPPADHNPALQAPASSMLERMLDQDDVAAITFGLLGPVHASTLRCACRLAHSSLTSTGWAQAYWRSWCPRAASVPTPASWFATFSLQHGDAHMRRIRTQRLEAALRERGLKLRRDSWLCAGYIARRSQVGTLIDVVDGMETMAFLFRATNYNECREELTQERWEEACAMAFDAEEEGDEEPPSTNYTSLGHLPVHYHIPLEAHDVSEMAKRRAVEEWIYDERHTDDPWETIRAAPRVLQEKVAALLRGEANVWGAQVDVKAPYSHLPEPQKPARRAEVRACVAARREEEARVMAPHIRALLDTATAGSVPHHFPATLNRRQRARLHDEAEELGLAHESHGEGSERHLVVWHDWH